MLCLVDIPVKPAFLCGMKEWICETGDWEEWREGNYGQDIMYKRKIKRSKLWKGADKWLTLKIFVRRESLVTTGSEDQP